MLNRVVLVGRITKDIELRKIDGSGAVVANFTIALDRRFANDNTADFIPCAAWNKTAENMAKYLAKGSLIAVEGRIQSRNYQAQDGTSRTSIEVVAETVQFLDSKGSAKTAGTAKVASAPAKVKTVDLDKELGTATTTEITNDDLPW